MSTFNPPIEMRRIENQNKINYILNECKELKEDDQFDEVSGSCNSERR